MVALLTDSFGLKSSKLAQLDSTKFDEEPVFVRFCPSEPPFSGISSTKWFFVKFRAVKLSKFGRF